ncbi:MAG: hypothetical protein HC828_04860 [Blastochloris sp.]|nr:hypothetical protein [Blastochloris sp.]
MRWSGLSFRDSLWLRGVILFILLLFVALWLLYASRNAELFPDWTGFNTRSGFDTIYPARTLWDWLSLLLVPIVLMFGGFLFTWVENYQAHLRGVEYKQIEKERSQDGIVQAYLSTMTELLSSDKPETVAENTNLRSMVRAHTFAALRGVDLSAS